LGVKGDILETQELVNTVYDCHYHGSFCNNRI